MEKADFEGVGRMRAQANGVWCVCSLLVNLPAMRCESNKVTTAYKVGGNGCLPGSLYHTVFIEQEILGHFLSFTESLHWDAFNSVSCCLYLGLQVFNTFHTIVSMAL